MTDPSPRPPTPSGEVDPAAGELDRRIVTFARRRARARARAGPSLWAQASWVGTVGWLIAVPIVVGALLGHLLDRRLDSGITWAMACMSLGVLAGGYALWRLGVQVREPEQPAPDDEDEDEGGGASP
jgi:ATP synthase protein I